MDNRKIRIELCEGNIVSSAWAQLSGDLNVTVDSTLGVFMPINVKCGKLRKKFKRAVGKVIVNLIR